MGGTPGYLGVISRSCCLYSEANISPFTVGRHRVTHERFGSTPGRGRYK